MWPGSRAVCGLRAQSSVIADQPSDHSERYADSFLMFSGDGLRPISRRLWRMADAHPAGTGGDHTTIGGACRV